LHNPLLSNDFHADYNLEEDVMLEPDDKLKQPASPTSDQDRQQISAFILELR